MPKNKILGFKPATKYLIWSVEHNGWWKGDRHGYSDNLPGAGMFSKEEAEQIVNDSNMRGLEECMIPVERILT